MKLVHMYWAKQEKQFWKIRDEMIYHEYLIVLIFFPFSGLNAYSFLQFYSTKIPPD